MENNKSKKSVNRVKKFFPILRSKSFKVFQRRNFSFLKVYAKVSLCVSD